MLTGENLLISKISLYEVLQKNKEEEEREEKNEIDRFNDQSPFLISGTQVKQGSGLGLVMSVGKNCQYEIIKPFIDIGGLDHQFTPLQLKLGTISTKIAKIGYTSAILTFLGCFIHLVINNIANGVNIRKLIKKDFAFFYEQFE